MEKEIGIFKNKAVTFEQKEVMCDICEEIVPFKDIHIFLYREDKPLPNNPLHGIGYLYVCKRCLKLVLHL